METLHLARHAFAVSNLGDGVASCTPPGEGLTAQGVEQARELGAALAPVEVDLGVATELLRTQETLDLALLARDVPRVKCPELNEIGFGRYDGGPLPDYRAWAWSAPPDVLAPGGGESRAQGAARYATGLRALLRRPEAAILAIGHALMVRYVLDAVAGLAPAARMRPVPHAVAHRLSADDVERAASLLESWSRAPRFRDPSNEG